MGIDLPPERGALWLENWVLDATIAGYSGQHANYPAKNLLTPHRSDSWRSASASGDQQVVFDLGSAKFPTAFALTDINFDAGATIVLSGADNAGFSGGARWDFPLYEQDPTGKVVRWYPNPNDATSGTEIPYRFWRVLIPTGTLAIPYEIGNVWLGEYTPIRPWAGTRIRTRNPSTRTRSYGRAMWTDPLPSHREVEVPIGGLTMEEAYEFEALVRAQGSRHAILDLHAYSTDAVMKRGGCMYGYFADDPIDVDIDSPENNSVSFSFEEASG
jgi:hypothetical protein